MTRARTQLLIMAMYVVFGFTALLTPGVMLDILGTAEVDRSPVAYMLIRGIGATGLGAALALFFFIADATSGRRMMRAVAALEATVIVGVALSLGADDLPGRAAVVVFLWSGLLVLLNLYGGFLAPISMESSTEDS
ncbi:MAG TPA: hypothetical protein VHG52_06820 [Thermomicrobiales bacterium]|nr:hypothetical protein [Thermomicrobiales bacterium]